MLNILLSINRKCCSRFALSAGEGARVPSTSGLIRSEIHFPGKAARDESTHRNK